MSLDERVTAVEKSVKDNKAGIDRIEKNTAELLKVFNSAKFVLVVIKWIAAVGAGLAAIIHFGHSPK